MPDFYRKGSKQKKKAEKSEGKKVEATFFLLLPLSLSLVEKGVWLRLSLPYPAMDLEASSLTRRVSIGGGGKGGRRAAAVRRDGGLRVMEIRLTFCSLLRCSRRPFDHTSA